MPDSLGRTTIQDLPADLLHVLAAVPFLDRLSLASQLNKNVV